MAVTFLSLLPSLITLAGSLLGKSQNQGGNVSQEALETPEQTAARKKLLEFADTAGSYTGPMGEYGLSDLEKTAQAKTKSLLEGGNPETLDAAKREVMSILQPGGAYDPNAEGGMYAPMKKQILQEAKGQEDVINRQAAISGDLYSKDIVQNKRILGENTSNTLSGILANLSENYANRRVTAANTAAGIAGQEESMNLGRINAAEQMGGIERMLKDAQIKADYSEWVRTRGEKLDTLSRVLGSTPPTGVKNMPVYSNGSWDALLMQAIEGVTKTIAGSAADKEFAKAVG